MLTTTPINYYNHKPLTFTAKKSPNSPDDQYHKAQEYIKQQHEDYFVSSNRELLDLDKLDGIQNGIKVFEGMKIKEILFALSHVYGIAATRGCYNNCVHCQVDAKKPVKENSQQINKMSWEDYSSLITGIVELNERLGFQTLSGYTYVIPLFYDADSMFTELVDKNGKKYDFIELNNFIYEKTRKSGIFDTSGWSKEDTAAQKRAEKYAEYYSKWQNAETLDQFNVSFNPFHYLNHRAIELKAKNDWEGYKRYRKAYVDRMANIFYTFTPLLQNDKYNKFGKYRIICRAASNWNAEKMPGYTEHDMEILQKEVLERLEEMYTNDWNTGNTRYIKTFGDIDLCIDGYKAKFRIDKDLSLNGRFFDLYYSKQNYKTPKIASDKYPKGVDSDKPKIIDANGKVYIKEDYYNTPTKIQFNFENKDKTTAPIGRINPSKILRAKDINMANYIRD